jgi:hypothetical protein
MKTLFFFLSFKNMFQHQKASSCTARPSLKVYRPTSTYNRRSSTENTLQELLTENKLLQKRRPFRVQSLYTENHSLPLPTIVFYSKESLINEYATLVDVFQYVSPRCRPTDTQEQLHLFIGVLHSLFTVIDDLTFGIDDDDDTEEEEEEEEEEYSDDDDDKQQDPSVIHEEWVKTPSFSIVGLQSMKVLVFNEQIKNLSLAIIVSSKFSDAVIEHYVQLLNAAVLNKQKKGVKCCKFIFLFIKTKKKFILYSRQYKSWVSR